MILQSKGKMYIAAERGSAWQASRFMRQSTFNFGNYQQEHKTAFEQLYVLNDEVLAPAYAINLTVEEDTTIALIPLIGAVIYQDHYGNKSNVVAGALQLFTVSKSTAFTLTNPYDNETVNFLQLWIKTPGKQPQTSPQFAVELDANLNQLPTIVHSNEVTIAIGKFDGRKEGTYNVAQGGNAVFAFVIDGQMEVQYRLLQSRDGLGLWDVNEVEFEALSATAIILMVEVQV